MAHLAGQFAGILRAEVNQDKADALRTAIGKLSEGGLESTVQADAASANSWGQNSTCLSLVGQDRPGIVREISRVLATKASTSKS